MMRVLGTKALNQVDLGKRTTKIIRLNAYVVGLQFLNWLTVAECHNIKVAYKNLHEIEMEVPPTLLIIVPSLYRPLKLINLHQPSFVFASFCSHFRYSKIYYSKFKHK